MPDSRFWSPDLAWGPQLGKGTPLKVDNKSNNA